MGKRSKFIPGRFHVLFVILLSLLLVAGCGSGGGGSSTSTHSITYHGNGNTVGTTPTDSSTYEQGETVTVLGNSGSLARTGYTFSGWNTKADGSGTAYASGATFAMGTANVTLYAQWTSNSAVGQVTILYSFGASSTDGQTPEGGVTLANDGYLYGSTYRGGANGTGSVFKLSTSGTETLVYSFAAISGPGGDARFLIGGVAMDSKGNLWGTSAYGGSGAGAVFEISPSGTETLYSLVTSSIEGTTPTATPVVDADDNVYGTTSSAVNSDGTIFKISGGVLSYLYAFPINSTGGPYAGLITDGSGNFYGTTDSTTDGRGEVFKITAAGDITTIYSFTSRTDGLSSCGKLARDSSGNLYGTTYYGGVNGSGPLSNAESNPGTVFMVSPSGAKTTLYSFGTSANDGSNPDGGVILDSSGNLYGTTYYGGAYGDGTLFKVSTSGVMTILYSFGASATDGQNPMGDLAIDSSGHIYGTTQGGGANGKGTVFEYH